MSRAPITRFFQIPAVVGAASDLCFAQQIVDVCCKESLLEFKQAVYSQDSQIRI